MKSITSIIFLIISLALISATDTFSQETQRNYELHCTFKNLPDKSKVYLTTQELDTLQSTYSTDSSFTFKGIINPEGRFLFITFDSLITNISTKAIFVINSDIKVTGEIGNSDIKVEGSKPHDLYNDLRNEMNELNKKYNNILTQLTSSDKGQERYGIVIDSLKNDTNSMLKSWIESNLHSLLTPYILESQILSLGTTYSKNIYEKFPKEVKQSYYGQAVKNIIKQEVIASNITPGSSMPNIPITDTTGAQKKINEITKTNKLTLIDCWASWCAPCRQEIPSLKILYAEFKSKGFNIIAVTQDRTDSKWKSAIEEDQTPWQHFKQDKNFPITQIFDLKAIPAYILVDEEGKIVAFDCAMSSIKSFGGGLRGEELRKTIQKHLN